MDLYTIEKYILLLHEFFRNHPDLCPHDWDWEWTKNAYTFDEERHYKCSVCGEESVVYPNRKDDTNEN